MTRAAHAGLYETKSASKNAIIAVATDTRRAVFHCSRMPHRNVLRHAKAKIKTRIVLSNAPYSPCR